MSHGTWHMDMIRLFSSIHAHHHHHHHHHLILFWFLVEPSAWDQGSLSLNLQH